MPDADKSGDEPNLELPSFGFRRRKKSPPAAPAAEEPATPEPVDQAPEPTEVIAPAAAEAVPPVASVPTQEPAGEPTRATAPAAPAADVGEDTAVLPRTPVAPRTDTPDPATPDAAETVAHAPLGTPVAVREEAGPSAGLVDEPPARARRERQPLRLPVVPGPVAAVVTGVVCGFITVFLAFASARGCQAVRGVGTCGGFGLFALIVILVLTVLIGGLLLRAFGVSDPTSTSFLGIGLMAVIVMLFFLDAIDSTWMLAVIPVLSAATFLLSWWVTTKFVDVGDEIRRG